MGWISNIRKSSCQARNWKTKYESQLKENMRLKRKLALIKQYCEKAMT